MTDVLLDELWVPIEHLEIAFATFAESHPRLIDVDRWPETAPMCGEWCPGYGFGFCLPLSTLPNRKCRVPAVDAPVNEPCIWRKS